MKQNKKVLVVSGFFPYPAHFGGAFDILERIVGLKQLGFEIDLLCTYKIEPDLEHIRYLKTIVHDLILVKRENRILDVFNLTPLQVMSRIVLKEVVLVKTYDFAILETEYVGKIIKNKTFKANKIFLRIQNNENVYFRELAKSTTVLKNKIYYYSDAIKFKFYSKQIFKKVDRIWFISKDELKSKNNQKSIHLPSPINSAFLTQNLLGKKVLFIGSLFMPNNLEGLKWYLNNIHPELLQTEGYELIIVGGTGDKSEEYFQNEFKKYRRISLYCNVSDLAPFYSQATVFINPMLHGAGVKLKTINAVVNGLPIVSTSKGSEGIGLIDKKMSFIADKPTKFYKSILKIFEMKNEDKIKMVVESQKHLNENNYLKIMKNEFSII